MVSTSTESITGIVLAGGKSSRMGTDKALLLYKGIPLISHAIELLRQVCSTVIISANTLDYAFTGCKIWPDEFDINASMAGICTALMHSETEWNLVISCDMPLVESWFLRRMIELKNDYSVVAPVHNNGTIEPLCAVYNKVLTASLRHHLAEGRYSMRNFILESAHRLTDTGNSGLMFLNVNTEQDFNLLNKS